MKTNIEYTYLQKLFIDKNPLIDVRAPIEFLEGSLPGAINIPILNNEERASIGTVYKNKGNEAAVKLGHELVSGSIKNERLTAWAMFIEKNPNTVLYCFRGGQRSQITQKWLSEIGINVPIITGGYKAVRNFLMEAVTAFTNKHELLILSGPTGSGKTEFINEIKNSYPAIDLEGIACHRGSAFGSFLTPQPTQINFENQLAQNLLHIEAAPLTKALLVEDESRLIGKSVLPPAFFDKMRLAPILWIDEPVENRVENIFKEYILKSDIGTLQNEKALFIFEKYKKSVLAISKKLGSERAIEITNLIENAEKDFIHNKELGLNKLWIKKLLIYYYDPMYLGSLQKRQAKVAFKGSYKDCMAYLKK